MRGVVRVGYEDDLGAQASTCRNEMRFVERLCRMLYYTWEHLTLLVAVAMAWVVGAAPQSPVCGFRGAPGPCKQTQAQWSHSIISFQHMPHQRHHSRIVSLTVAGLASTLPDKRGIRDAVVRANVQRLFTHPTHTCVSTFHEDQG